MDRIERCEEKTLSNVIAVNDVTNKIPRVSAMKLWICLVVAAFSLKSNVNRLSPKPAEGLNSSSTTGGSKLKSTRAPSTAVSSSSEYTANMVPNNGRPGFGDMPEGPNPTDANIANDPRTLNNNNSQ